LQTAQLAELTQLFSESHAQLAQLIPVSEHGKIQAIMFNLGYLPGAEKHLITQTASTLTALAASVNLLSTTGLLSILAYPGHPGGAEETQAVSDWIAQLPSTQFNCEVLLSTHPHSTAPRLFLVEKLAENLLNADASH
jgi:Putative rRNA methylase